MTCLVLGVLMIGVLDVLYRFAPDRSTDGMSQVVDHTGTVLAEAACGESLVANAVLDLAALRRALRRPGMGNLLARVKPGLWAAEYARADVERANGLEETDADRAYFLANHTAVIDRLAAAGVIA